MRISGNGRLQSVTAFFVRLENVQLQVRQCKVQELRQGTKDVASSFPHLGIYVLYLAPAFCYVGGAGGAGTAGWRVEMTSCAHRFRVCRGASGEGGWGEGCRGCGWMDGDFWVNSFRAAIDAGGMHGEIN